MFWTKRKLLLMLLLQKKSRKMLFLKLFRLPRHLSQRKFHNIIQVFLKPRKKWKRRGPSILLLRLHPQKDHQDNKILNLKLLHLHPKSNPAKYNKKSQQYCLKESPYQNLQQKEQMQFRKSYQKDWKKMFLLLQRDKSILKLLKLNNKTRKKRRKFSHLS